MIHTSVARHSPRPPIPDSVRRLASCLVVAPDGIVRRSSAAPRQATDVAAVASGTELGSRWQNAGCGGEPSFPTKPAFGHRAGAAVDNDARFRAVASPSRSPALSSCAGRGREAVADVTVTGCRGRAPATSLRWRTWRLHGGDFGQPCPSLLSDAITRTVVAGCGAKSRDWPRRIGNGSAGRPRANQDGLLATRARNRCVPARADT